MSAIHDFGQQFFIANIFWSRMADQNREMVDQNVSYFMIFVSHSRPKWLTKITNG
jgi:hypothetical protein